MIRPADDIRIPVSLKFQVLTDMYVMHLPDRTWGHQQDHILCSTRSLGSWSLDGCQLNLSLYRLDCRVAANCRYCFYSQAKNEVFRPARATRCTDSGQTLQHRRAPGSAWLRKISRQSVQRGGNAAPKYQKFPLFGKESPRRGDFVNRFPKFLGAFIRLTILR